MGDVTVATPRTRLKPEDRRTQLLDLGVQLLATRAIDEVTIDLLAEEAGISRGLLYHYFGNKHDFHEAVVRRAIEELVETTAPPREGDPLEKLLASMTAYVDYVIANQQGYVSLIRAAAGGNETVRKLRDDARFSLTDRIFTTAAQGDLFDDTPANRLIVRGWSAYVEDLVLAWCADPRGIDRDKLLALVTDSLPALLEPPAEPPA